MVKAVTFFLIGMLVLAMFGRLRMPWQNRGKRTAKVCPKCGRHRIGKGPCECGAG